MENGDMSSGLVVVRAAAPQVHPWYAVRVRSRFEFVKSAIEFARLIWPTLIV
jgi:hypothetical protein